MHFLVFVGANAAISMELMGLEKRHQDFVVVAPAVKKGQIGPTIPSIERSWSELVSKVKASKNVDDKSRLTICSFPTHEISIVRSLWSLFGGAGWINFVSLANVNKPTKIRQEVDQLLVSNKPLLHIISSSVYGRRKTSPLCLPMKNFHSSDARITKGHWYRDLDEPQLKKEIHDLSSRHRQRICADGRSYSDERGLFFLPAKDTECHGIPHPTGVESKSFFRGKFRFGVSLFPGFHYDVTDGKGRNLQACLVDIDFGERDLRSESRKHINVFPNDVLLPRRS